MIRTLIGQSNKPLSVMYTADVDMTRGAFVTVDEATKTVELATGATMYMVDVAPTYTGINAVVVPTDSAFEKIVKGDRVILVPVYEAEVMASTEVTAAPAIGDKMQATSGVLAAAVDGDWVYLGTYSDPTGLAMHQVKRA